MTREEIINGLKMSMELTLFDPSTGEVMEPYQLNDINRTAYEAYKGAIELLEKQPERNTGQWIDAVLPNDNGGLPVQVCDQCNTFFPLAYTGGGHNFCPNCGADMRGDKHETD